MKLREGPLAAVLPAELGGPPPLPGAEVSPDPEYCEAGGQLAPHRRPAARTSVQPQQPRVEILLHLHTIMAYYHQENAEKRPNGQKKNQIMDGAKKIFKTGIYPQKPWIGYKGY